ncbi:MAG: 50S ribosomal protein L3 [Halobacteriovoraceae bacterium]|nr:50S ribosomal protein L3 [Halobacteriovoraceae bacterium]
MTDNEKTEATTPEVEATTEVTASAEQSKEEKKAKGPSKVSLKEFYGLKAGMTRIFDSEGRHVPVTVVKLIPNYITQVKTADKDGYAAYQVGYYEKRAKLLNKPTAGHLKKAGLKENVTRFYEVQADEVDASNIGKQVDVLENFTKDTYVDVTSISKGKGFQGVIKRHGFRGGPASHGSHFHRHGGSIGNRATPGRVFKLKKMPGHMGQKKRTIQNLRVIEVNQDQGYMLVKGSIPGHKNSFVKVQTSVKK